MPLSFSFEDPAIKADAERGLSNTLPPPPVIANNNTSLLDFRPAHPVRFIFIALLLVFALSSPPAQAQSNPTATSCGLPAGGAIVQTVTYSLSADCELTSTLTVAATASLTINGNGHAITPGSAITLIEAVTSGSDTPTVTLNRVTLDGKTLDNNQPLNVDKLIADQVTFMRNRDGVWGKLNSANHNWSLTRVLFRDNHGLYLFGEKQASALDISGSATLTLNNTAFERNLFGPAALHIVGSSATVTVSGCLTESANLPYFSIGSYTNNRANACTGKVGNNHDLSIASASQTACGMPAQGEVRADAVYTLSANCRLTGALWIKEGVTVTIKGNGRALLGDWSNTVIWVGGGGRLNIDNLVSQGVRMHIIRGHLEATLLAFYGPTQRSLFIGGTANLNKLLIRDQVLASRNTIILLDIAASGDASTFSLTIRDAMFINNANGDSRATLWAVDTQNSAATITLEGCISFIDTAGPEVTYAQGVLVDNRTGACPNSLLGEFGQVVKTAEPRRDSDADAGSQTESATRVTRSTIYSLPDHIRIFGFNNSTQAQVVSGAAIGNDEIAARAIAAVDVWSWVLPNTQVCFVAAGGAIKFIDTAPIPRVVYDLPVYSLNGMICATINGPGIVVLMPGGPAPASAAQVVGRSLSGCMVTATTSLNFRASPGGAVIGGVGQGWTLTALARTEGWFLVDRLGEQGWISADYVEPEGTCG